MRPAIFYLMTVLTSTAMAENYCTMTVPGYSPGVYDSFSTELTTGGYSNASGNIYYTYSGLNKFEVTSGSGNFTSGTGGIRYGVNQGNLQVFQSIITPNYLSIASASTACPSAQTYNWLLVRSRTPDLATKAMTGTSASFPVGGVFSFNPASSPNFSSTALFSFSGSISTTFNLHAYNYSSCMNGSQKVAVPSGQNTAILDTLGTVYFDTDRFFYQATGGNPVAAIGATPETLSSGGMTTLSKNVFSGIYTEYLRGSDVGSPAQNRRNLLAFMTTDGTGSTFSMEEPNDANAPGARSVYGSMYCSHANLNNPSNGFARCTFTVSGSSAPGVCLFSTTGSNANKLMACLAQRPANTTQVVSYVANINSRSLLSVMVEPISTTPNSNVYPRVTLENLSGRNIPTMGYPASSADRLPAYSANVEPFDDYYGSGTALYTVNAPTNCSLTQPLCGTSLAGYAKCQLCLKYGPGSALFGATLKAFKVAYDNGAGTVNATANLLGTSTGSPPTLTIVSDVSFNQATSPTFKVLATYSDQSVQDVTAAVVWSSSSGTFTGNIMAQQPLIIVSSVAGLTVGTPVFGPGIPIGATITWLGGNAIKISALPTANTNNATIHFSKVVVSSSGVATFRGTGNTTLTACVGGYDSSGTCAGPSVTKAINVYAQTAFSQVGQRLIGQANFTTAGGQNYGGLSAHSISSANSVIHSDGQHLLFADAGNRRVLIWNTLPASDNEDADIVLGQPGFNWQLTNNPTGDTALKSRYTATISTGATGIYAVRIDYGADQTVTYQYNSATTNTTTIAQGLAAQIDADPNLTATNSTNTITINAVNGGFGFTATSTGANTVASLTHVLLNSDGSTAAGNTASKTGMNVPKGVWSDGTRIAVADSTNNRVLIWTSWPTVNGQAPDLVLGQATFNCNQANSAAGSCSSGSTSAQSLSAPLHAYSDGIRFLVADSANFRVLIWKNFPTSNQQAADLVLGQSSLSTAVQNCDATCAGAATTGTTRLDSFTNPSFIASDGQRLFVSDFYRVVGWDTFPTSNRAPANLVIGQPTGFISQGNSQANGTGGTSLGFSNEYAFNTIGTAGMPLHWDKKRLFVSDPGGARVLSFGSPEKYPHVLIPTAVNSTAYSLSIDGVSYSYTSDSSATVAEINAGLASAINANIYGTAFSPRYVVASPVNSTSYTVTVAGTGYSYTSDSSATIAEIVSGLNAKLNATTGASPLWSTGVTEMRLMPKKAFTPVVSNNTWYEIYYNAYAYSYQSDSSATATKIVTGLKNQINADSNSAYVASGTSVLYLHPKSESNTPAITTSLKLGSTTIVPTAANSTVYSLAIDGVNYQVTSDSNATATEIVSTGASSQNFVSKINNDPNCKATASGTSTLILAPRVENTTFKVSNLSAKLAFGAAPTVTVGTNLTISDATRLIVARTDKTVPYTIVESDANLVMHQAMPAAEKVYGQPDFNCTKTNSTGSSTLCATGANPAANRLGGPRGVWSDGADVLWISDNSTNFRLLTMDTGEWASGGYASLTIEGGSMFQGTYRYDFGFKPPTALTEKLLKVTNTGNLPATSMYPSANVAPFKFKNGIYPGTGGTCGTSLPPGQSCYVNIVFWAPAIFTGNLTSGSNTITGIASTADLAVGMVVKNNFAQGTTITAVGTNSVTTSGTATSTGTVAINASGDSWSSTNLQMNYSTGNASNTASATIRLQGMVGIAAATISPTSKSYGSVAVNSTSDQTFTITNSSGHDDATITSLTPSNSTPLALPFKFKGGTFPGTGGTCGGSMGGAGSTCTVVIQYAPTASGSHSGSFKMNYWDGKTTQTLTVPLSGTAP